ncbi:hypothetical protein C1H46_004995 [Malus baccata]|uniref:Uncharacterized protein n=1 Tax=Malus baccata TaxID=106549 RepID=A0A540NEA0_MALBA|nr:hypothetical protein C1H46_004995 [Malus baccata]
MSTMLESSTSSMTHPLLSARRSHRRPRPIKFASASTTVKERADTVRDVGSIVRHHSWRFVPQETKDSVLHELSHHYDLEDLDTNQAKFDDPVDTLAHGCPLELVKCPENWAWLCTHFQDEKYLVGSKFPEIDTFKEVYVRPGDEFTKGLHAQRAALEAESITHGAENITLHVEKQRGEERGRSYCRKLLSLVLTLEAESSTLRVEKEREQRATAESSLKSSKLNQYLSLSSLKLSELGFE